MERNAIKTRKLHRAVIQKCPSQTVHLFISPNLVCYLLISPFAAPSIYNRIICSAGNSRASSFVLLGPVKPLMIQIMTSFLHCSLIRFCTQWSKSYIFPLARIPLTSPATPLQQFPWTAVSFRTIRCLDLLQFIAFTWDAVGVTFDRILHHQLSADDLLLSGSTIPAVLAISSEHGTLQRGAPHDGHSSNGDKSVTAWCGSHANSL